MMKICEKKHGNKHVKFSLELEISKMCGFFKHSVVLIFSFDKKSLILYPHILIFTFIELFMDYSEVAN